MDGDLPWKQEYAGSRPAVQTNINMSSKLPSQKYLQECFAYDPTNGLLTWKERPRNHFKTERGWIMWNSRFPNKLALNYLGEEGYLVGTLGDFTVKAHRVIFKWWTGTEPHTILHAEGKTTDNRIGSLSVGTQADNMKDQKKPKNNTSGVVGVSWHKIANKWLAKIKINGKSRYLGLFEDIESAANARKSAEIELGFHVNHGQR